MAQKKSMTVDEEVGRSARVFVDHEAALDFLNGRTNFEHTNAQAIPQDAFKLDRMRALVKALGDPHKAAPVVHVAGSKGKGSTCAMLESSLRACGYATGMFVSPHLIDERERVRINGVMVDESVFDSALAECKAAAEKIEKKHGKATYFELLTALSFVVFANECVDIMIVETGLGGRLDCTNVVEPMVVGLTTIQLEHTAVLGGTLEEIAFEKGGIMKKGSVAISVPQEESVVGVFRERASEVGSGLVVLGEDVLYSCRFQSTAMGGPVPKVCVGQDEGCFEHMPVPLLGEHQGVNCGLALAILMELRERGFDLPERQIIAGLEGTSREGRLERVHDRPQVYIDGAHTPESVRETLKAAAQQISFDSMVVIFGCASDKRVDGMLEELTGHADKVIFTRASSNPRAMKTKDLVERFGEMSVRSGEPYEEVADAIRAAGQSLGSGDLLLVLGSFYLAGEVKSLLMAKSATKG